MNGRIDGWMHGWTDGWMDGRTDGWDGRTDGRTDGRMDGSMAAFVAVAATQDGSDRSTQLRALVQVRWLIDSCIHTLTRLPSIDRSIHSSTDHPFIHDTLTYSPLTAHQPFHLMRAYMHTNMRACARLHTSLYMSLDAYTYVRRCVRTYVRTYACMHACMACMHVCTVLPQDKISRDETLHKQPPHRTRQMSHTRTPAAFLDEIFNLRNIQGTILRLRPLPLPSCAPILVACLCRVFCARVYTQYGDIDQKSLFE